MKFSDGARIDYMWGPSQLATPVYLQLKPRVYAATNGVDGGVQTDFVPGPVKP